ncbi:TRAP transporter small permease subunit [Pseudomarimonas arenosa]|uniref:TRAP transporter small permease protein n=1 Tax=Pseudomarimonas arenosa TaxID=2774145 RepID=A0AAW3ZPQ9_9GAMM|nr:TRAP transporter small permease subunit [Pseudomarimonas arenosa]MBD8528165.1 TRAP transporter small permease subunit [Pseudomarimonas arenosa]
MNLASFWLDRLSRAVDAAMIALVPLLVALTFALVLARYFFSAGSIAAQEAGLWMHSLIFMLGAAGTLRADKHVRVDVWQQRQSPRVQAWIDLLGHALLLLPFAVFMGWISFDYVAASWSIAESSREPGGLPGVYLLKAVIPLTAALLLLQSLCEIIKRLQQLASLREPGA